MRKEIASVVTSVASAAVETAAVVEISARIVRKELEHYEHMRLQEMEAELQELGLVLDTPALPAK